MQRVRTLILIIAVVLVASATGYGVHAQAKQDKPVTKAPTSNQNKAATASEGKKPTRSSKLEKLSDSVRSRIRDTSSGRGSQEAPDDGSVTAPMRPSGTYVLPEFAGPTEGRITATLPEDGKSQTWTGKEGQLADAWVLTGYSAVNIKIESKENNDWRVCYVVVRIHPMPSPDPTIRILGDCNRDGKHDEHRVYVAPSAK